MRTKIFDVIVIGGGQAALAVGYFLKKTALDFIILDDQPQPGGAWRHTWESLRLFSPVPYSSLPGIMMQQGDSMDFPSNDDVVAYLRRYEQRYALPVYRPHHIDKVTRDTDYDCLLVSDGKYQWRTRTVASATGNWSNPFIPDYHGREQFRGKQVHSAQYRTPDDFMGQRVLVVGGGNSGAQIFADIAQVADTSWVTLTEPLFLPDEVDGRVLFERATARIKGDAQGVAVGGIGDIVMVPTVKAAREKGILRSQRPFTAFTEAGVVWPDSSQENIDAVIWCTGFRPALDHLAPLGVIEENSQVKVTDGQANTEPRLWLFGYGDWASPGSATLIGAARSAKEIVPRLVEYAQSLL